MLLNDGTGVLGAATPRQATPTEPTGETVPQEFVERVAGMTVAQVGEAVKAGEFTAAEVAAAEDETHGGRGRKGVLALAAG